MHQRKKLLAAIIFSVVLVVSLFLVVSLNQIFLFSKNVTVEEITHEQDINAYSTLITDDGEQLASIYFRIEQSSLNHHMLFSLTPYNQTEVDSLTLRFSAGTQVLTVYKEATRYMFKDSEFYQKDNEIVLNIPDAGFYGSSTLKLKFILEQCSAEQLSVTAEISMHQKSSFQLMSQKAQVFIDAMVPEVNLIVLK